MLLRDNQYDGGRYWNEPRNSEPGLKKPKGVLMKKYVFGMMMALVSSSALADQSISLSAGSKVRLNVGQPTVVVCEGQQGSIDSGSRCKISNTSGVYYSVIVDGTTVQTNIYGMESAIEAVKKLRSAGLCN